MERSDLVHSGLILGLSASVIVNICLMISVYLRSQSISAIETTDRVQSIILAAYASQTLSVIMILLNSTIVAIAFIALFLKFKSWEVSEESEE